MPTNTRLTTSPLTLAPGSPVPEKRWWEPGTPTLPGKTSTPSGRSPDYLSGIPYSGASAGVIPDQQMPLSGRPPDWLSGYPYQTPGATPTPTGPMTATSPGRLPDYLSGIPYSGGIPGVIPDKQMTPWEQWVEQTPTAAYGAWTGGLQGTPALKRYYEGMQNTMYGRYLGAAGATALGGQMPTQTFTNYLQNYPEQQQYQNLPGWMRGYNPQQHSPRYRWLNY